MTTCSAQENGRLKDSYNSLVHTTAPKPASPDPRRKIPDSVLTGTFADIYVPIQRGSQLGHGSLYLFSNGLAALPTRMSAFAWTAFSFFALSALWSGLLVLSMASRCYEYAGA